MLDDIKHALNNNIASTFDGLVPALKEAIREEVKEAVFEAIGRSKFLENEPDMIPLKRAAEIYGDSPRTINNWVRQGEMIPPVRVGNRTYFQKDKFIDQWETMQSLKAK